MKVLCTKKAYHKGEIWREGKVYDYPGDNPPGYAFKILSEAEAKEAEKAEEKEKVTDAPGKEEKKEEKAKEKLVADASRLGIGPPSALARWSIERLEKAIAEARA